MKNDGKMDIRLTRPGAGGRQFLRFTQTQFDELGEAVFQQTGFVEVDPEKAESVLAAYQSGERKKAFGRYNRQTGLYDLETVRENGSNATPGIEATQEPAITHARR